MNEANQNSSDRLMVILNSNRRQNISKSLNAIGR
jgi:hypothetical protein